MCSDSVLEREVVLATGVSLPLFPVATILLTIENLLIGTEADRERAVALRIASLDGSPMPEPFAEAAIKEGLIRPEDRCVERITRHVVLAAVRGEGKQLYLVSPYTNRKDRVMSDLIISATKAQALLSPDQVAELLVAPQDELGPWTRRVNKGPTPGSGGVPPPSPN